MRKLILILLTSLVCSKVVAAKSPQVEIIEKSEKHIIVLLKDVDANSETGAVNRPAYDKFILTVINHCKEYNKDAYLLIESSDQNLRKWLYDERVIWQTTFWGNTKFHMFFRINCELNPGNLFKKFDRFFGSSFDIFYDNFYNSLRQKSNQGLTEMSYSTNPNAVYKLTNNLIGKNYLFSNFEKKNLFFKEALEAKANILKANKFDSKDEQFNFVCYEQLNLRKGTSKFNECVYNIMTMELELAKINAEKEIALAKAEAARANQLAAEEATAIAIAEANSQKFKKNISNLLLGLLVLGEINQGSPKATNFKKTFTCTPTGFASGIQYSVNCF